MRWKIHPKQESEVEEVDERLFDSFPSNHCGTKKFTKNLVKMKRWVKKDKILDRYVVFFYFLRFCGKTNK